jgi:hypothetical protein
MRTNTMPRPHTRKPVLFLCIAIVMFVCSLLEFGALSGVPMRPEQIQELMRTMNQPKLAHVIPNENENGDGNGGGDDLSR